jgi:hypothetical protein
LTTVKLPSKLQYIENNAFENCTGLKTVYLPKTLKAVRAYAFNNCTGIQKVCYQGNNAQWKAVNFEKNNTRLTGATIQYNTFA